MKRRKTKKMVRRRSRGRISGIKNIDFMDIAGVVAGAVVAGYLNKLIPADKVSDKMLAGGKVALGVALPMFVKNKLGSAIGNGMIAVGSVDLLKSFGVLKGDFDIPVINGDVLSGDYDYLSGDDDIPVINGDNDIPVINGDVLSGDDDYLMSGDDDMMSGDDDF